MGLESATFLSQLNASNPIGASDPKSQGDDHIRLIKSVLQATFPNATAAYNLSPTEANYNVGLTGTTGTGKQVRDTAPVFATTITVNGQIISQSAASNFNPFQFYANGQASGSRGWAMRIGGAADFGIYTTDDAGATQKVAIDILRTGTVVSEVQLGNTTDNPVIKANGNEVGLRRTPFQQKTANYVLAASDVATLIEAGTGCSSITFNNSIFAAGDTITIVNNSAAAISIVQGSGVTLSWAAGAGSFSTGSRTLAIGGVATIYVKSAALPFIWGTGLS